MRLVKIRKKLRDKTSLNPSFKGQYSLYFTYPQGDSKWCHTIKLKLIDYKFAFLSSFIIQYAYTIMTFDNRGNLNLALEIKGHLRDKTGENEGKIKGQD